MKLMNLWPSSSILHHMHHDSWDLQWFKDFVDNEIIQTFVQPNHQICTINSKRIVWVIPASLKPRFVSFHLKTQRCSLGCPTLNNSLWLFSEWFWTIAQTPITRSFLRTSWSILGSLHICSKWSCTTTRLIYSTSCNNSFLSSIVCSASYVARLDCTINWCYTLPTSLNCLDNASKISNNSTSPGLPVVLRHGVQDKACLHRWPLLGRHRVRPTTANRLNPIPNVTPMVTSVLRHWQSGHHISRRRRVIERVRNRMKR